MKINFVTFVIVGLFCLLSCKKKEVLTLPSDLKYTIDSLSVLEGENMNSQSPTIKGSIPITYEISKISPSNSNIEVNATTGVISVNKNASIGSYLVSIKAINEAGSTNFENVYKISVIKDTSPTVTFTNDIKPILISNCTNKSCHPNFTNYSDVKNVASLVKSYTENDYMPLNTSVKLNSNEKYLISEWIKDGLLE